jgi:hypothetical protein
MISKMFVDVDYSQVCKDSCRIPGDVFFSEKTKEKRTIITLSDGLGSGVKADVLATLTATMATKFISRNIHPKRTAEIIMKTLPIDKEMGISYATFTIVDIEQNGLVRLIEYDNPSCIIIRNNQIFTPQKEEIFFTRNQKNQEIKTKASLFFSQYNAEPDDRIVFFSDGVSHAGMGQSDFAFGWKEEKIKEYVINQIQENSEISAKSLSEKIVNKAHELDNKIAKDDISCGVVYFRKPRDTMIFTGPPIDPETDEDLAALFISFSGQKIISGGTTANIISKNLNLEVKPNFLSATKKIPPYSTMQGADLVCEGILTLSAVADILEKYDFSYKPTSDAAGKMIEILLNSDRIFWTVGTKINEAHQNPSMPVGLEIRRNIVKRISDLLERKFLKEIHIQYI